MALLTTNCLPSALGALVAGPQGIPNVTQFVGSDGQLHTLPAAFTGPIDLEYTAPVAGAQALAIPVTAANHVNVYVNGLLQSQSLHNITGLTLNISAAASILIGDQIIIQLFL